MRRARSSATRDFYLAVGRLIAKARIGHMTQETLATRASLTRTSINNIEKGRQQILLHTLIDIARALGVSVSDLIPETYNLENMLRDKPQRAIEWVKASTAAKQGKGV